MRVQLFAVVAAFALLAGVSAGYTEEENVLVLGDANLDAAIAEFPFILVEFYAPWCGHCKNLAPEYAKAATTLKNEGSNIRLAKVDATVEREVAGRFAIRGYPTLKFFVNGQAIEYEGGRTERELVNWVKRKSQPSTREVNTAEELAKETKDNEVVVVFFGGKDAPEFQAFETVSRQFDDVAFVYTTNGDLRTEQNVEEGAFVLLLKKFDEGRNQLTGAFTVETLRDFVENNRFPTILPFNQKAAQKIFGQGLPALFLIYQRNEQGNRAEEVLTQAAAKLKGKIQLSISDINDGQLGPRLAEFVGIKHADTPAFRIVQPQQGAAPKKFLFEGEVTVDNLVKFFEDYAAGRLKPFLKSEPIPERDDGAVKTVVGNNFEAVVYDTTKDVFIELYAPWCGHCKNLAPVWEDLARSVANVKNLVIAKMDATANEVEGINIQGFPTLKFFPANNKRNPLQYDGARTKEAFLEWLKDKVQAADKEQFKPNDEL